MDIYVIGHYFIKNPIKINLFFLDDICGLVLQGLGPLNTGNEKYLYHKVYVRMYTIQTRDN